MREAKLKKQNVSQSSKVASQSRHDDKFIVKTQSSHGFTLQRRLSTATSIKYDMYLLKVTTAIKLFGASSDRTKNIQLCHQNLLKQKSLVRFEDLPMGSSTMFVSHEWLSRKHPDPLGVHVSTLLDVLRNLRNGKIKRVNMEAIHRLTYKHNFSTSAREWSELLENAYVVFEYIKSFHKYLQTHSLD